jgi:LmbE family N-acetylglucosaminyl deacetylase
MSRIVLSPHPDDAVLSLGPCMRAWTRMGDSVRVLTIFDGAPRAKLTPAATEDRARYSEDPVALRQKEDLRAVGSLGATLESAGMEELVYRYRRDGTPRLQGLDDLYGPLDGDDEIVVDEVVALLQARIPESSVVYVPMATGGHSDHRVIRVAAERLWPSFEFYDDMPYAVRVGQAGPSVQWPEITAEDVDAWIVAVNSYESQLGPLFESMPDWENRFRSYAGSRVHEISVELQRGGEIGFT